MKKNRDALIRHSRSTLFPALLFLLVLPAAVWGLHLWRTLGSLKEETQEQEVALIQARISVHKLKELIRTAEARAPLAAAGESVVAFLEAQATKSGIAREKIMAITPGEAKRISDNYKEAIIKVRLEEISLKQLVAYLFNIQQERESAGLSIRSFRLEADRKLPNKWQANIDLASLTYEPLRKAIGSE